MCNRRIIIFNSVKTHCKSAKAQEFKKTLIILVVSHYLTNKLLMGKSQETFNKKEKEKMRLKKRQDKQAKRDERKANPKAGFEDMISYIDEYGNPTDTPPDLSKKKVIKAEDIEIGVPRRTDEEVDPIRNGKVEFFNDEKGFGFIKENDTNEKYFVHVSSVSEEIRENDKVSFELEQGMKGLNAVRVKKI